MNRGRVRQNAVEHAQVPQHLLPGALEQHTRADRPDVHGAFDQRDRVPVACQQVRGGGTGHAEPDDPDAKPPRHG